MFACQFGRYRYTGLPFGDGQAVDMCQRKIAKTLKELPNVFVFADNILIIAYDEDGTDQHRTLCRVLNKNKYQFSTLAFLSLEKLFLGMGCNLEHMNCAPLRKCQHPS